MNTRPWRLTSPAQAQRLLTRLDTSLRDWQERWLGPPSSCPFELSPAEPAWLHDLSRDDRAPWTQTRGHLAEAHAPACTRAELGRLMWGEPQPASGTLAHALLAQALDELLQAASGAPMALAEAPDAQATTLPRTPPLRPGHGQCRLQLHMPGGTPLTLLLLPASVQEPARITPAGAPDTAPTGPLHTWAELLPVQTLRLRCDLGSADLSVAQLRSLRPGDVLRLNRPLQAGAQLTQGDHTLPAHAHPCQRGRQRAVLLAAPQPAAT